MSTKNNPTISEKIASLDQLITWFDSDEFTLEEAVAKYEAAEALAGEIEKDLDTLKGEITVIKKRFDE